MSKQATNHTPGPWRLEFGGKGPHVRSTDSAVARVMRYDPTCSNGHHPDGPSQKEAEANAHLIAAAPDLLEALEASADALEKRCMADETRADTARACEAIRAAHDAIARAKGVAP